MGRHLTNSKNKYDEAARRLTRIEDKFTTGLTGIETAGALPEETPLLPGIEEEEDLKETRPYFTLMGIVFPFGFSSLGRFMVRIPFLNSASTLSSFTGKGSSISR